MNHGERERILCFSLILSSALLLGGKVSVMRERVFPVHPHPGLVIPVEQDWLRVKISHAFHDWPQHAADTLSGAPLANHMDAFSLCRVVCQFLKRQDWEKDGFYSRSLLIRFKIPIATQNCIVTVFRKLLLFHAFDKSKWQAGSAV